MHNEEFLATYYSYRRYTLWLAVFIILWLSYYRAYGRRRHDLGKPWHVAYCNSERIHLLKMVEDIMSLHPQN